MIRSFVNWQRMWFHFTPITWNVKSVKDNFPYLLWFMVKNMSILSWFHTKLLKLHKSGIHTIGMKLNLWNSSQRRGSGRRPEPSKRSDFRKNGHKNSKFYEGLTTEQFFLANKIFFWNFCSKILSSEIKVMQFTRRLLSWPVW